MEFNEYLQSHKPILLDGAMGTLLGERGYELPAPKWSAAVLENSSEVITGIHREYINAGANMLTTATFRTTSRVYTDHELPKDLNYLAVRCAREAIGTTENVFIAGSVAPLEDCYRPDLVPEENILYNEHLEHASWLVEAGVDCLLFETMNSIREANICARIGEELGLPFFVSFVCDTPDTLLSGEPITQAISQMQRYTPTGILINCTQPKVITTILQHHAPDMDIPMGGYANMGRSQPQQGGTISEKISPEKYRKTVRKWLPYQPILIGACCGSTPEHIVSLTQELINFQGETAS